MESLETGHKYKLIHVASEGHEELTFLKRSSAAIDYKDQEHPGTNTQEVLRALIDRSKYLDSVLPCKETQTAIKLLQCALYCYEVRAWRRKQEKLNKSNIAHSDELQPPFEIEGIEFLPIAREDGHIIIQEQNEQILHERSSGRE